jgi:hypothetical protein
MADYYAILKRAIGALPEPTGEARRAVYEKARTALVAQLKSFDPPLSASDITQQRLQLEDAIRKVESEAAKGLLSQALSRAAGPERPAAAATTPAPAPRQTDPQPATAPAAQAPRQTPVTAPQPQPERQPPAPAAAALFSRSDREPTGQTATRPPLSTPEPTSATRPPLARPQFEPATRPPVTREAPTGSRPQTASPASPTQPTTQAPQSPPPTFSRERAPTGQTGATATPPPPPPMPAYFEQEDVTQPVSNRAFRSAVKDMDRLGTAAHESARRAREALGGSDTSSTGDTTMPVEAARKAGRRPLTAQSKPAGNSAPPPLNPPVVVPRKTSRWPIVVGLIVAALVLLGGGGLYWKRDVIASYLGAQKPVIDLVQRSASEKPFVKSTDRLLPDDGAQKAPANPGVKVVTTQPITPGADTTPTAPAARGDATPNPAPNSSPNPGASPAAPAPGPNPQAAATSPAPGPAPLPNADVPPIAQKVTLLEEAADGNAPPLQSEGKVVWQLVKTPSTQAGKPDTVRLQGRVEVPTRGIVLMVTVEQNSDAGLQASHLIKLDFKLPPDFDSKSVARVPGVILKPAEGARGDPLAGATAKITSNLFWIALYSADADKTRNIQLLKERGWIDIPIVYETNKRAMLTLEKAGAGDRVFSDAFAAWGN